MRKNYIKKIRERNPQVATVEDVQKIIDRLQGRSYLDIDHNDGSHVSIKLDDDNRPVKLRANSGVRGTKAALAVSIGWNVIMLVVNTVRFTECVIYINEGAANEARIVLERGER